jgi:hypothetical protein
MFHPNVWRVLQPEDRAFVVVATGGPSNDLVERKRIADPLAPPGRKRELVGSQHPAIRDERERTAPCHHDLAGFEPGGKERVAFGQPPLPPLDRLMPPSTPRPP